MRVVIMLSLFVAGVAVAELPKGATLHWNEELSIDLDGDGKLDRIALRGETLSINDSVAINDINDQEEAVKPRVIVVNLDTRDATKELLLVEPGIEDECLVRFVGYRDGQPHELLREWIDPCASSLRVVNNRVQVRTQQYVNNGCKTVDSEYRLIDGALKRTSQKVSKPHECPPG